MTTFALWSGLALLISTVPLAIYPLTILTAPAAIVVGLIGLRKPPSLTGRRRVITLTLAMAIALTEIGAWIWVGRTGIKTFFGG